MSILKKPSRMKMQTQKALIQRALGLHNRKIVARQLSTSPNETTQTLSLIIAILKHFIKLASLKIRNITNSKKRVNS